MTKLSNTRGGEGVPGGTKDIEAILLAVWRDGREDGYEIRVGLRRNAIETALQQLQSYITNKEREARIDEVERLKFTIASTRKDMGKPEDLTSDMAIKVRLFQLKQEDNGGSNE